LQTNFKNWLTKLKKDNQTFPSNCQLFKSTWGTSYVLV